MGELGFFDLMLPAFCECLVLVGIHSYLGLHVIRRKVIFVDLALAQVAALGATVGFLFGMAPDSVAAFIFSVMFTIIAAAVFSVARLRSERVPQEAIIGLVYAIAAAVIILVIDRAPHGAEHIKEVMTGAILWVRWESILFAAIVYSLIGVVHVIFAKQFLLISRDPEAAFERGMRVRLWDFLFYVTFGVVISISVRTAGVLLVFVFLVVPAITATLITDKLRWQLVIGWTMGVAVTVVGLWLSYVLDVPSGPAVVTFYGAMLVVAAVVIYLGKNRSLRGGLRVAAGVGVAAVAFALIIFTGLALGGSSLARSRHAAEGEGAAHAHEVRSDEGAHEEEIDAGGRSDDVARFLRAFSEADDAAQARLVNDLGAESEGLLTAAFEATDDDVLKLAIARHVARRHGSRVGGRLLRRLLGEAAFPFVRAEAASSLDALAGRRFGFDPEADEAANRGALEAIDRWLAAEDDAPHGED